MKYVNAVKSAYVDIDVFISRKIDDGIEAIRSLTKPFKSGYKKGSKFVNSATEKMRTKTLHVAVSGKELATIEFDKVTGTMTIKPKNGKFKIDANKVSMSSKTTKVDLEIK